MPEQKLRANEPVHDILVLIAYAQEPTLNARAGVYGGARNMTFGMSHYLYPYFVYTSTEYISESAQLCSIA